MESQTIFCTQCGRKITYDPSYLPKFCPGCGCRLSGQTQEAPAPVQPDAAPAKPAVSQDTSEVIRFAFGETAAPPQNARFVTQEGEHVFNGWLPEGFTGTARHEPNLSDIDVPVILWAQARHPDGTEYFLRQHRRYEVNKLAPKQEAPFRPFDDYLDENAAAMLGTGSIRLIKQVAAFEQVEQQIRESLQKRKQEIEAQGDGHFLCSVVQGMYGAIGGKLYEADVGGRKKYLLLRVQLVAEEVGSYSPSMIQSQQKTAALLGSMRSMVGNPYMGMHPLQPQQPAGMPVIDTDPNTPFGKHRTDGLTTNKIRWSSYCFGGFLSDTMPTRDDICTFYKFLNSLRVAPAFKQQLDQLQNQLVMQEIQVQQRTTQIMGQMVRDQQASFVRQNEIMRSTADFQDQMFQQRMAAENDAFDRRTRQQHEMIMGVNTFAGTDGMNVEADARFDRVFQNNGDPTQLIGADITADVPFGWTELDKLK